MPPTANWEKDEIGSLFHLTLTLHHLNKDMERKFRLSLVQLFVLLRLRSRPASSAYSLSQAIGIQPSTLSPTIQRLARKDYIFVTEDPRDSRKKLISLTRRGKETTEAVQMKLKVIFQELNRRRDNQLGSSLEYLALLKSELSR